jgi:two-component system invasion response regulator UvrY
MPEMFKEIINVLIVEDNLVLRETLSWLLKLPKNTFDYHVMEAASGEQAVKKAMDHNFDIIIMDYRMPPGISGLEATQQILRLKPEIKILSFTTDLYAVKDMVQAGAKGGISKNFKKGEMDQAIKTLLTGKTYFSSEIAAELKLDGFKE